MAQPKHQMGSWTMVAIITKRVVTGHGLRLLCVCVWWGLGRKLKWAGRPNIVTQGTGNHWGDTGRRADKYGVMMGGNRSMPAPYRTRPVQHLTNHPCPPCQRLPNACQRLLCHLSIQGSNHADMTLKALEPCQKRNLPFDWGLVIMMPLTALPSPSSSLAYLVIPSSYLGSATTLCRNSVLFLR